MLNDGRQDNDDDDGMEKWIKERDKRAKKKNSRDDVFKFTLLHANLYDFNFIIRYSRVVRRD